MKQKANSNFKHLWKKAKYPIKGEDGFLMAAIGEKTTGLPMIIWFSVQGIYHVPAIKVQSNYAKKMSTKDLFIITIEENPRVIGYVGRIKRSDIFKIIDFVKLTTPILLDHWEGNITSDVVINKMNELITKK